MPPSTLSSYADIPIAPPPQRNPAPDLHLLLPLSLKFISFAMLIHKLWSPFRNAQLSSVIHSKPSTYITRFKASPRLPPASNPYKRYRVYSTQTALKMSSDLSVELTAPNGVKYSQPIGLYINGEFVKSSNGQKIETINPTWV
jgi:hypothetical protein